MDNTDILRNNKNQPHIIFQWKRVEGEAGRGTEKNV